MADKKTTVELTDDGLAICHSNDPAVFDGLIMPAELLLRPITARANPGGEYVSRVIPAPDARKE